MPRCTNCGTVTGDTHFCPRCGASLAAPTPQPTAEPTQSSWQPPEPSRWEPPPAPPYQQPPPYQGGYPQPYGQGYGQQWPPVAQRTNGMAIASLVLGIVWMCGLGSILAVVFGYIAKNQIDRSGGTEGGRGMAIAGIVLGWVGVAFLILFIVLSIIGAFNDSGSSTQFN